MTLLKTDIGIDNSDKALPSKMKPNRERNLLTSLWRGFRLRCPNCNYGRIFHKYLKVTDTCNTCGEDLHHQRADDAPPYFTIFIVGHIIIPLVLSVELAFKPSYLVHAALWLPSALILTLILLPIVKGGLVALQWALFMHGFGDTSSAEFNATKSTSHEITA